MKYGVVDRYAQSRGDDLLYEDSEREKKKTEITKGPKDTNAKREDTTNVKKGVNRSGANENIIQKGKVRQIDN